MAEFVQSKMKVIKPDGAILVSPEFLEKYWDVYCNCKYNRLLTMKRLRRQFMERVYPKGTKVLHRFEDCGLGSVLWANDELIAVHFENGDEYAYHREDIKRLYYPIRSIEAPVMQEKEDN